MKIKFIITLSLVFFISGCSERNEIVCEDAEYVTICQLKENISPINAPQSFDMLGEDEFVLTDWAGVYLYDSEGSQLRQIGSSGRAQFEYNRPAAVRVFDGRIYVWSSGTLKFIEFMADGTPVAEYPYSSAITDFKVSSDNIYIYTAGIRRRNVIDVYDKKSQTIKASLTPSTDEHKFSIRNISSSPMCIDGESLVYASKDKMELYKYDNDSGETCRISDFTSKSFVVEEVADTNMIYTDWDKAMKYYNENPITLFVNPHAHGYYLMTAEGEFAMENNGIADGTRCIGLYDIRNNGSSHVAHYPYGSIGTQTLFAGWLDNIYFIEHLVDDDDIYVLKRLIVSK